MAMYGLIYGSCRDSLLPFWLEQMTHSQKYIDHMLPYLLIYDHLWSYMNHIWAIHGLQISHVRTGHRFSIPNI